MMTTMRIFNNSLDYSFVNQNGASRRGPLLVVSGRRRHAKDTLSSFTSYPINFFLREDDENDEIDG